MKSTCRPRSLKRITCYYSTTWPIPDWYHLSQERDQLYSLYSQEQMSSADGRTGEIDILKEVETNKKLGPSDRVISLRAASKIMGSLESVILRNGLKTRFVRRFLEWQGQSWLCGWDNKIECKESQYGRQKIMDIVMSVTEKPKPVFSKSTQCGGGGRTGWRSRLADLWTLSSADSETYPLGTQALSSNTFPSNNRFCP